MPSDATFLVSLPFVSLAVCGAIAWATGTPLGDVLGAIMGVLILGYAIVVKP